MMLTFPSIIGCATCVSQEGQTGVAAANGAVFVMIGALAIVFLSIAGVLIGFIRRSRRLSAAMQDQ